MQTRIFSTHRVSGIRFVSFLGSDQLLLASSNEVIWYRFSETTFIETQRSSHEGRSFSLFPIQDHSRVVLQLEDAPEKYSVQLLDENGSKGRKVSIPIFWINQVTANSTLSIFALFGSAVVIDRAGWIPPVKACLLDMDSGELQILPYSAIAVHGDFLYFVSGSVLFKLNLAFSRSFVKLPDVIILADAAKILASNIPSDVISLVPSTERLWLVTTKGLFSASSLGLGVQQTWQSGTRTILCGDLVFLRDIGPEIEIHNAITHEKFGVCCSSGSQIISFDVRASFTDGANTGVMAVVSEGGVLDLFAWTC